MILQIQHEPPRLQVQRGRSTALLLPTVMLSLIEKAKLQSGNEFLGRAGIIGVVCLALSGQSYTSAVMAVVVPKPIDAVAASIDWKRKPRVLWLILPEDDHLSLEAATPS